MEQGQWVIEGPTKINITTSICIGFIHNRVTKFYTAINLPQPSSFSQAWDQLWTKYITLSIETGRATHKN